MTLTAEERTKELAKAKAVLSWCLKSEAAPRLNAVVDLSRSEPGVPLLPDQLDANPWLLNCPNGTVDLRTGELRPHRREDWITQRCPVPYDPNAEAVRWCKFIVEVMDDKAPIISWLKRFLGSCLTGCVQEQLLPIFWGSGANGKSVLINAIQDVLGEDYAIKANRDLFVAKKGDAHPSQLARLFRKRFVVCIETAEGARLDEGLVKELTGGDRIAARRMREDWWEFNPSHKAVLVTNHKPEVRGIDNGIWRRLRLIPFNVTFPEAKQDKQLSEKLKAEAPGILRWMVDGCLQWQSEGLGCPESIMAATEQYRDQQDVVGSWLAERCQVGSADYREKLSKLYDNFHSWCERNGEHPVTSRRFGDCLRGRSFEAYTNNGTWYRGVAIRPAATEEAV